MYIPGFRAARGIYGAADNSSHLAQSLHWIVLRERRPRSRPLVEDLSTEPFNETVHALLLSLLHVRGQSLQMIRPVSEGRGTVDDLLEDIRLARKEAAKRDLGILRRAAAKLHVNASRSWHEQTPIGGLPHRFWAVLSRKLS